MLPYPLDFNSLNRRPLKQSELDLGRKLWLPFYTYLFWMHYNNIYRQWKRLGRLHSVGNIYKTFLRSTFSGEDFSENSWKNRIYSLKNVQS